MTRGKGFVMYDDIMVLPSHKAPNRLEKIILPVICVILLHVMGWVAGFGIDRSIVREAHLYHAPHHVTVKHYDLASFTEKTNA